MFPMLKVCQSIRFGILAQAMVRQFGFTKGLAKKIGFILILPKHGESLIRILCVICKALAMCGVNIITARCNTKRQQGDSVKSPEDMLYELGLRDIEIVPRVDEIQHGIQATRDIFSQCWFDETHCKEGLAHLQQYRKEWNDRQGAGKDKPRHDIHSEAADAFRQFTRLARFRQQIKTKSIEAVIVESGLTLFVPNNNPVLI